MKLSQTLEHVAVTFFEAVIAYVLVVPKVQFNKGLLVGAIGAGLSAVYNVLRQSTPPVGLASGEDKGVATGVASVTTTAVTSTEPTPEPSAAAVEPPTPPITG